MFFEAESNGNKFQVKVLEERHHWDVSLNKNEEGWKHLQLAKNDFQTLDETISFYVQGAFLPC